MKPYALTHSEHPAVSTTALEDLALVRHFMETLPEPQYHPALQGRPGNGLGRNGSPLLDEDPMWTCHALVRAAKRALPLQLGWTVRDGAFGEGGNTHCWLEHVVVPYEIPRLRRMWHGLILDVYPRATLSGPVLLDADYRLPWQSLYRLPNQGNGTKPADYTNDMLETYAAEAAIAVEAWGTHNAGR